MTILVAGGSNSLMRGGWVTPFAAAVPNVVNASLGATTTQTALFQVLRNKTLKAGDTVIWEYALNDASHVVRGSDAAGLHRDLEHLIRHCIRLRLRLLLAVFTGRADELTPSRPPYFDTLLDLAAHYEIAVFDLSVQWRLANDAAHMPAELYADPMHYALRPSLMQFIATGIAAQLPNAKVPQRKEPRFTGPTTPRLVQSAEGPEFRYSILTLSLSPAPMARIPVPHHGRVLGFYCMCQSGANSGVRVTLSHQGKAGPTIRVSTTPRRATLLKLFKAYSLTDAHGASWPCAEGDVLTIRSAKVGGIFHADVMVKKRMLNPQPIPAFVAALIEVDEDLPEPDTWLSPLLRLWKR